MRGKPARAYQAACQFSFSGVSCWPETNFWNQLTAKAGGWLPCAQTDTSPAQFLISARNKSGLLTRCAKCIDAVTEGGPPNEAFNGLQFGLENRSRSRP